jgi:hypothetical protein
MNWNKRRRTYDNCRKESDRKNMSIWDDSFDAESLIADLSARFARSETDEVTLAKEEFKQIVRWLDSFLRWAGDDFELYRPSKYKGPKS